MRLVSWNVNGLRAAVKKGFEDSVLDLDADAICLQETKLQRARSILIFLATCSFGAMPRRRDTQALRFYASRAAAPRFTVWECLNLILRGRLVALELPEFWLVDVYTPNAQDGLARIDHRMAWDDAFRDFCKGLEAGMIPAGVPVQAQGAGEGHVCVAELPRTEVDEIAHPKPVVMCGDFNVAHEEIDLKNPKTNRGNAGFSDEERGKFTDLLDAGFVDTFRTLHPDLEGAYSWWSYRFNARKNNAGWRIDYFLVSEALRASVEDAAIHNEVLGSDHCPVSLDLRL